ncbi:uncharacterized protein DUF2829 [Rhizobium azibense]|nr:uncharacterized protein DUF2829 [Rhizobium azibense]
MNFGKALEFAKKGAVIRRADWKKSERVYMELGSRDATKLFGRSRIEAALNAKLFQAGDKGTVTRLPNFNMKTPGGETLTGWQPTQLEMVAEDWEIVDGDES